MQKKVLIVLFALVSVFFGNCFVGENANKIIRKSVAFYGMNKLDGKTISFDFREKHFTIKFDGDDFSYQSTFKNDSLGSIKDQLTNKGFVREQNGLAVALTAKDSTKYVESLNSVVYFAFLPLKLQDDAVNSSFLKTVQVNGKSYHQIEVSFDADNGGSHHTDVFYFWFDAEDSSMDYFAYSEGGNRFRASSGTVKSNGLALQNYTNLENKSVDKTPLSDYHVLYEQDKLSVLSSIVLKNLSVK